MNKNGNTQLPQPPVDEPVVVEPDEVVAVVVEPEPELSWHVLDSSPRAANMNLFWVMTAALLETPATPVGVPVAGRMTAGFE